MSDDPWRTLTARLGWVIAVAFLLASVISGLLAFNITASEPSFSPDGTFVDRILVSFESAQARWPQDLASSLLFTVGFASVATIGAVLRRSLGRADPRGSALTASFLLAGTVGVISQLLYIGGTEVATNPEYCDCGFLAEEIISRAMAHDILLGIVSWMIDGFTILFALGLWLFGGLGRASGWVSGSLATFSRVLAAAGVLAVIWGRIAVPLLVASGAEEFDFGLLGGVVTLLIGGILVPVWAAWLARAARREPVSAETG